MYNEIRSILRYANASLCLPPVRCAAVSLAPSLRLFAADHLDMRIMLRPVENAKLCVLLVYFIILACKPEKFIAS